MSATAQKLVQFGTKHVAKGIGRLTPEVFESGSGSYVTMVGGRKYLDFTCGIGVTNLVARATARADELSDDELRAGLPTVVALAERVRPAWVAFLGLGAYRTATGERRAVVGPQERRLGPAAVWLLPNPSGLNASWQLPRLTEAYAALRSAAWHPPGSGR